MDRFPTVEGVYAMTKSWSIELPPGAFKRRIEDGSLVVWRPGVTAWINVWNNDRDETIDERAESILRDRSPAAYDLLDETSDDGRRFAYRLREDADDARVPALYAFAVGRAGHVQMAVYFDAETDAELARTMWRGLRER
jgi:hypothetical protein